LPLLKNERKLVASFTNVDPKLWLEPSCSTL
jgi:hypothetical protein